MKEIWKMGGWKMVSFWFYFEGSIWEDTLISGDFSIQKHEELTLVTDCDVRSDSGFQEFLDIWAQKNLSENFT